MCQHRAADEREDGSVDAGPAPTKTRVEQAWAALSPATGGPPLFQVDGAGGQLPSRFAVEDTAVACVAAALLAAGSLHESRGGKAGAVTVDRGQVAAAVRSERYFQVGGRPAGPGFASLSRFFEAGDGWVRTHANYPWHKQALLQALDAPDDADAVAAAIRTRPVLDVENLIVEAGGVAAAVRSPEEWARHPQGLALAAAPLVAAPRLGDAAPRRRSEGPLPAAGVRVLDLTRVIAGPVSTRYLGALGADVLRLDPPRLPDLVAGAPADSLLAKRSAFLDASGPGRTLLHALLDEADALVCGYRPGSLDRLGLDAESVARAHPGLVVVVLGAWGHTGPWAGRRGFDSIVQAAAGIAHGEAPDGATPGALPCQLLDHGTGYLMAAAVLDGLRAQSQQGGTQFRYLSLARTASWLMSGTPPVRPVGPVEAPSGSGPESAADAGKWLVELDSPAGPVQAVAPPGRLGDKVLRWPAVASIYGSDEPVWLPR
jgi:crotonobetainyl-CoA:carnitine CoA-transferase CaiB-like acyl-CoA transferase